MKVLFAETEKNTGRFDLGVITNKSAFEYIKFETSMRHLRRAG